MRASGTENAHAVAYYLAKGDVPKGLCINHSCNNKKCCNPSHLFVETYSRNIKDAHRDKLAMPSNTKLSPESIKFIRSSEIGVRELSAMFGVHPTTIYRAKNFQSWRY